MADEDVWIQLYVGEEKSGEVFPIEIASLAESIIDDLKDAVHQKNGKSLGHCNAADLVVYKAGTEFSLKERPLKEEDKLSPGKPVPEGTSEENPLCVLAPAAADQPPQMMVATESFKPIIAYLDNYLDKKFADFKKMQDEATLSLSKAGDEAYLKVMTKIGIPLDTAEWDVNHEKPSKLEAAGVPPFAWHLSKEDSPDNRKAYMAYLNDNIIFPQGGKLFDGTEMPDLLSVYTNAFGVHLKGNIDVVLAPEHNQEVSTTRSYMWAGIELKKVDNQNNEEIQQQVILQHLAASFLNENTGILTIMTDICERWHFYWFSKQKNALMTYDASSRGEAIYLIRNMMKTDKSAPQDFLNRASWNQMFPENTQGGEASVRETGDEGQFEDDFMDEEEEREARFRGVLECILPQLGIFPRRGSEQGHHTDDIPRHIDIL